MTTITGDLIIGSSFVTSGQRSFRATNPATSVRLDPVFAFAGDAEVDRAAELAWSAFDRYRETDLETRAHFLETIADNIMDLGDALIERGTAETGLSAARFGIERARTVNQLRLFARVVRQGEWLDLRIDPALPDRKPFPRPDLRLREIAIGPVAVFGASNFPLAFSVAGGDTAAALAAGCPVIVKGHPAHPGTGELIGRAIQAAVASCGLPEGVFSLLLGAAETGAALVRHPRIKAVGFTGSRGAGTALVAIAAARAEPIPVYAEMSSINPVFILPAALAERTEAIAKSYVDSLALDSGQYCTNPGLVFALDGPDLEAFLAHTQAAIATKHAQSMLTAGIHEAFDKGVDALAGHPDVQTIGRGLTGDAENSTPPALFLTEAKSFETDEKLGHEVFGASSLVVRCRSIEEMIEAAERMEGQLTATLQLDEADIDTARRLMPTLERKVGRILANGWPTGVEVSHAMVHGGPFPATSDSRSTSVGTLSIRRFLRPVSYQNLPDALLPTVLQAKHQIRLPRLVDGQHLEGWGEPEPTQ
ncbi:aldehyde dehydrogenase (NADP(+)) [Kaistia dalseonensis]|uniref:NADP-dependent aldehyde dehydrogenase n=1 Tax=Kaistia dalseonensis TaxID=410840 RepID=A0ABU0HC30_9HYPH|nr:aldehyde dehydrogenase (NADP(+)) [Kaistia dalseonensis]MCX5496704.1 aldehyde dehydrogenase (NADP(+)) [Kaistia dalseonensis]MDQ0439330.1 NADP-dependent aldehyde dehydrogenase [Kaistia dalseonensis]